MFFLGICGIDNKHREVRKLNRVLCKNCNEESTAAFIKAYKYFHIFFIPIIKYNYLYFVKCDSCQAIHQIKTEKGKELENGKDINITIWDLKLLSKPNKQEDITNVCSNCGVGIDKTFKYCPHCGNRIKINQEKRC
mgnify:CR=1 FL=1